MPCGSQKQQVTGICVAASLARGSLSLTAGQTSWRTACSSFGATWSTTCCAVCQPTSSPWPSGAWPTDSSKWGACRVSRYGGGDSLVVRALDSWLKGPGFKSLQEHFLLQGQLSVLTYFGICSTLAVARKRSHSFCKKCRLQLNTRTSYICGFAWSDMYSVHRTRWDDSSFMWRQPCQCCKYTTSVDIQTCYKKIVTHVESQASTANLLESGE